MKSRSRISMLMVMTLGIPLVGLSNAQGEPLAPNPASGTEFASTAKCTANSPCQNVTGEVLTIQELYLIREADGRETRMTVTRESRMQELPKVGDSIAAQMTSSGEVQSLSKLPKVLERQDIPVPSSTQGNLREQMNTPR